MNTSTPITAPFLTTRMTADILQLRDVSTVTKLIRKKLLNARYIGTRWLISPGDLALFVASAPTVETKRYHSGR